MADYQWPGNDPGHYTELEQAVKRNCDGACGGRCAAHLMLDNVQLLEHLAFVKAKREMFRASEFNVAEAPQW